MVTDTRIGVSEPMSVSQCIGAWSLNDTTTIAYIYGRDNRIITRFVAWCLRHGIPFSEKTRKGAFNTIISVQRRFIRFTLWLGEARINIYSLSNLLRDSIEDMRDNYSKPNATDIDVLCDTINQLDDMRINAATMGTAAMNDYLDNLGIRMFARSFPVLDEQAAKAARKAYYGGFVWARKTGDFQHGKSFDINSLYPSIMRDSKLPYGTPEHYSGIYEPDDTMPLHCDLLTFRADLKHDGCPFLMDGGTWNGVGGRRVTSTNGFVTAWLTDIDQQTLAENYDLWIAEYHEGYKYQSSSGFFQPWVDQWYGLKSHHDKGVRQCAKLMLNALTGKFGMNPRQTMLAPYLTEHDDIDWQIIQSPDTTRFTYAPVSAWITSYARQILTRHIRENWHTFVYCDTDSMILCGDSEAINVTLSDSIGDWKIEREFTDMRILGTRKYEQQLTGGGTHMCFAGVHKHDPIPYDQFQPGNEFIDDNGIVCVI